MKEDEASKGDSDCEAILIASWGVWSEGGVVLQASLSRQVFPLWGPFFPINFFPIAMKVILKSKRVTTKARHRQKTFRFGSRFRKGRSNTNAPA